GLPLLQAIRRDPFGFVAQLRARHGDAVKLKVLATSIYYLFRPEAARQVLVNHQDDFVKDQRVLDIMQSVHGANVITTEGTVWERQRRMLTPAFAPKRIAACAALMAAAADECVSRELPSQVGVSALVDVDGLPVCPPHGFAPARLESKHGIPGREDCLTTHSPGPEFAAQAAAQIDQAMRSLAERQIAPRAKVDAGHGEIRR
ncbi:MAG: cytochrome P450, partial [Xanthomonadaceae bacterium]|nr:cytochrome P450 [Xanthomonadaceae bacterium]